MTCQQLEKRKLGREIEKKNAKKNKQQEREIVVKKKIEEYNYQKKTRKRRKTDRAKDTKKAAQVYTYPRLAPLYLRSCLFGCKTHNFRNLGLRSQYDRGSRPLCFNPKYPLIQYLLT